MNREGLWEWKVLNDEYYLGADRTFIYVNKNNTEIISVETLPSKNAMHIEYICEKLREIYHYRGNDFFKRGKSLLNSNY